MLAIVFLTIWMRREYGPHGELLNVMLDKLCHRDVERQPQPPKNPLCGLV